MRDKKKKLLGYRVRIPFDGQHNRDNQNGFIRFTTFCPWFGKRHEFFPVASKRKKWNFLYEGENSTYTWKRWSVSLTIDRSPFVFALCLFSFSLILSLFPSLVQRTDDPVNKKINLLLSFTIERKLFYYSVTLNIFKCCKVKGAIPMRAVILVYRYYR